MCFSEVYERSVCYGSVSFDVCFWWLVLRDRNSFGNNSNRLKLTVTIPHQLLHILEKTIPKTAMHFKPPSPSEEVTTPTAEEQNLQPQFFYPMEPSFEGQSTSQGQSSTLDTAAAACTNDYHCVCADCQNKYGSLPLLLQGIEQKYEDEKFEPQPSTSSEATSSRRTLSCEYCKKTFTHKGDFNKHLRKHTREKPFSCSVCERKFAHTSNLLRHQRLHTGDRPYVCDNCDKSFSRKDKLDSHRRSKMCQARTFQ